MKFSLIEILFVIAIAAFAISSVVQGNQFAEILFVNFTYVALLAALPMAIGRTGGARAFWVGFLITAIAYLLFVLTPAQDGSPRNERKELTTRSSIYAFDKLEETMDMRGVDEDPFTSLKITLGGGQKIVSDESDDETPFSDYDENDWSEDELSVTLRCFGVSGNGQSSPKERVPQLHGHQPLCLVVDPRLDRRSRFEVRFRNNRRRA